jgi:two-component system cell cycle sensor histidine kinase/response regulator CckA
MKSFQERITKTHLYLFLSVITVLVIFAGLFFYQDEKENTLEERQDDLHTISDLKAQQLLTWLDERISNAQVISQRSFFIARINEWMQTGGIENSEKGQLQEDLRAIMEAYSYSSLILCTPDGNLLLDVGFRFDHFDPGTLDFINKAHQTHRIIQSDFYYCNLEEAVHYDIIIPLKDTYNHHLATLILRSDPHTFVFPFLLAWPYESQTGETILLRAEGDSVRILNTTKNAEVQPLEISIPVSQTNQVEVQAISGHAELIEGTDYRDQEVLAYSHPIQETSWVLVTKMDKEEIYQVNLLLTIYIGLFSTVFLLFVYSMTFLWYTNRQKNIFRKLWQSREEFRTTLNSIGDAVITTDKQGRIQFINPVAEQLTGWQHRDAVEQDIETVFHVIDEDSHQPMQNPVQRILKEGIVIGLANHSLLINRSNKQVPIADSGAPIRAESGETIGTVLVFRDQTKERAARIKIIESEKRYKLLFESNPIPMWVYDLQTLKFIFVNDSAVDHYGYSREEFLQMDLRDIRPPDEVTRLDNDVRKSSKPLNLAGIWKHKKKSGEIIFVEIISHIINFEGVEARLVQAQDISGRKRAEIRFRQIWEVAQDGMRLTDEKGIITAVNEAFCQIVERDRDGLIGKPLSVLYRANSEHIIEQHCQRFKEHSIPVRLEGKFELHNGTEKWFEVANTFIDIPGEPEQVLAIFRDISERKRSEQDLLLRDQALNSAGNAIMITSPTGTIQWVNRAFSDLTGYSPDDAVGTNPRELLKPESINEEFDKKFMQAMAEGVAWTGESTNQRKDGSKYQEVETITPVVDADGVITNLISIKTDVTEKRQLQEQLAQSQKMEAIGKLAGGVAHDFNNLLTVINGYSEMMLAEIDSESRTYENLQQIKTAGERASALTRQLLAFSRKQVLQTEVLNLNKLIGNTEKMLQRIIGEDIDLETFLSPELYPIRADAGQIEQIILNLAVNARDAMPNGGKLTIETDNVLLDATYSRQHTETTPGHYILMAISDNGTGMDKKIMDQIFEPFFTTKGKGKGTGLGLSTVYGIVRQSGGNIWVYSEAGKGTTFKIYLPAIPGSALDKKPEITEGKPLQGSETILVVEDEKSVRTLVETTLRRYNYSVLTATDGVDALEQARSYNRSINLILTDVVMPSMSGRELIEHFTELHPESKICFMSGYTDNAIVHHGVLDAGVNFIQKPFLPTQLARKIREILDKL